jgi:protein-disulfide isomerase
MGSISNVRPDKMTSLRFRFYATLAVIALCGTLAITKKLLASAAARTAVVYPGIHGYSMGDGNAPIEVDEFGDFECHYCREFFMTGEKLIREKYVPSGLVRFTFYDNPSPRHRHAEAAALAAACADDQDKFWEMSDSLFSSQPFWKGRSKPPLDRFTKSARAIGLEIDSWTKCYNSKKYLPRIRATANFAQLQGFNSTPTILVTVNKVSSVVHYKELGKVLDSLATTVKTKAQKKKPKQNPQTI